jgi:host factor-I protein
LRNGLILGVESRRRKRNILISGKMCLRITAAPRKKGTRRMASDKQNLQDAFLNHVRKSKVPVTIFLINGVKLQGVITWFDNFCVLLRRDGQSQLVYKHAISTIMPAQPINLYEGED